MSSQAMNQQNLEKIQTKNQKYTQEQRSNYSCSLRESLNKNKRTIIGAQKRDTNSFLEKQSQVTADKLRQLDEDNKQLEAENDQYLYQDDEVNQEELQDEVAQLARNDKASRADGMSSVSQAQYSQSRSYIKNLESQLEAEKDARIKLEKEVEHMKRINSEISSKLGIAIQ